MTGTLTMTVDIDGTADLATRLQLDPAFMAGIRRGLLAYREGRMVAWKDVKMELGIE